MRSEQPYRDVAALLRLSACWLVTRSDRDGLFRFEDGWGGPVRALRGLALESPPTDVSDLPIDSGGPSTSIPLSSTRVASYGRLYAVREPRETPFTEFERELLHVFAATRWADLRTRRLETRLSALSALTREAGRATEAEQFLRSLAATVAESLGFARCAVFLAARRGDHCSLTPAVLFGYKPRHFPKSGLRCDGSVLGSVLESGEPVAATDGEHQGFRRMIGARAFVAAPIRTGGESIGVLLADNRTSLESIAPERVELFCAFARQAGVVLQRLRTHAALTAQSEALAEEAAFRENLLISLGTGVMATCAEGLVTAWNPRMESILGLGACGAIRRPVQRVLYRTLKDESSDKLLTAFESALESGLSMHLWQQKVTRADGVELYLNVVIAPITGPEEERMGLAVVMEDVSDRVALETDMERMRHMARIGQLTAQIAHELRNPLTSIRGAAQILENMQPDGPASEFARIICQEVTNLNQIADEFLDFARPTQLYWEAVDMNHLLRQVAELWRAHCKERRVRIVVKPAAGLPTIWVDTARIKQVLRNLILNAVQAMPRGGTVTISSRLDEEANEAVITVRDTGAGMTAEQLERAFEPFYTTKTKGTGLGLSIVEKLVRAHGGHIELHSKEGRGTSFSIRLSAREPVQ